MVDEKGREHEVGGSKLPEILTLPSGTYTITVVYKGQSKIGTALVSEQIPLARINVEFELEDDLFLLEDLQ